MMITVTPSRWISPNSSATSKRRFGRLTTVPPPSSALIAENWPVPCISGQADEHHVAGHVRGDPLGQLRDRRRRRRAEHGVAAGTEHVDEVVLAPHHALRHAGRPARVQQEEVVAAAGPGRRHPVGAAGDEGLVRRGPVGPVAGLVGDDVPTANLRQALADPVEQLGERGVEHDRLGVGVVEQVEDLLRPVAEVGVHRDGRDLEGGVHRLQVLRPVVQVLGDLGLLAEPGGEEVGGERVGPPVELPPRDDAVALHLAGPVGHPGGDRLVDVGQVPVGRDDVHRGAHA